MSWRFKALTSVVDLVPVPAPTWLCTAVILVPG